MKADEGMWIPLLIDKYNLKLMQEKGFRLTAEDIYSVNRACMKDAVVIFGSGCTGALLSSDGLLITNHHCGYDQVQQHSSLENDYLTNGFWAMSHEEELPNPGLTVTFLKWMEDVTEKVFSGISDEMDKNERLDKLNTNIVDIRKKAEEGTGYKATVQPFFMGNQYFLFVNETFRDVRLVGAPPSAIGKFGGETDNWIWPRHTGDFSLFRIYADNNNKPADYSKDNIPYSPSYYFPVSIKGINEGDFTMVFGYPGTTRSYVPSYYIEMVKNHINPQMIEVRSKKIEIMENAMDQDPLIRLQYSAKKSRMANSWKKWIGEIHGLERMDIVGKKREFEKEITGWIEADGTRRQKYGTILSEYKKLYSELGEYYIVNNFTNETIFGIEVINLAKNLRSLIDIYENDPDDESIKSAIDFLIASSKDFFKNYNKETDKKLFIALMKMYDETLDIRWQTPEFIALKNYCNGDFSAVADKMYDRTCFTEEAKFISLITGFNRSVVKKIKRDPFFRLAIGTGNFLMTEIMPELTRFAAELGKLNLLYMKAQMEFDSEKVFYPDANSTLRISYGTIKGYYPRDAVYFMHYTTLNGIIEKDDPEIYDYDVPDKLKELYLSGDFGRFAQEGELPVCFIADNHTTGGNSGSPVINAEGHLIGINFDRVWEGVASDMAFNPELSRNISLDIRYAFFIIEKYAGAGYLLRHMTIIE